MALKVLKYFFDLNYTNLGKLNFISLLCDKNFRKLKSPTNVVPTGH